MINQDYTQESLTDQKELNKKIAISNQNRDKSIARSILK